jgi:hypothetical protein
MRLAGQPDLVWKLWRRGTSLNLPGEQNYNSVLVPSDRNIPAPKLYFASAGNEVYTAIDEKWLYGLLEPDNEFVTGVSEVLAAFMFRDI